MDKFSYLAGFFDGDGSVRVTITNTVTLHYTQKDYPLLKLFRTWLGEGWEIHEREGARSGEPLWRLKGNRRELVIDFILTVGRHTVKKKAQLAAALAIAGVTMLPGYHCGKKIQAYRRQLGRFIAEEKNYDSHYWN